MPPSEGSGPVATFWVSDGREVPVWVKMPAVDHKLVEGENFQRCSFSLHSATVVAETEPAQLLPSQLWSPIPVEPVYC